MLPLTGPGRHPSREMTADHVVDLLDSLEDGGIRIWLDGGWAVDAVLGEQTRTHDDLDLVVELTAVEQVQGILERRGYVVARGDPPTSFEMVDSDGLQVDVHPVVFSESGEGVYRMENGEDWIYPAAGFGGDGRVRDRLVHCLTPEAQMLCHADYEPHVTSYDDVWALSKRFGIPVPHEYRRPRTSLRPR